MIVDVLSLETELTSDAECEDLGKEKERQKEERKVINISKVENYRKHVQITT